MAVTPGQSRFGIRDQQAIVAAIQGDLLPTSAYKQSIALLEQRIVKRFQRRQRSFARAAALQKRVLAPLMSAIKNDRRAAEAANTYEKPPRPQIGRAHV